MRHLFHAASLGIVIAATGASAAEVPAQFLRDKYDPNASGLRVCWTYNPAP
jgi:hypothetical protein